MYNEFGAFYDINQICTIKDESTFVIAETPNGAVAMLVVEETQAPVRIGFTRLQSIDALKPLSGKAIYTQLTQDNAWVTLLYVDNKYHNNIISGALYLGKTIYYKVLSNYITNCDIDVDEWKSGMLLMCDELLNTKLEIEEHMDKAYGTVKDRKVNAAFKTKTIETMRELERKIGALKGILFDKAIEKYPYTYINVDVNFNKPDFDIDSEYTKIWKEIDLDTYNDLLKCMDHLAQCLETIQYINQE